MKGTKKLSPVAVRDGVGGDQQMMCPICLCNQDVQIPDQILEHVENVVIFAGAGVSTEHLNLMGGSWSLYSDIADSLGIANCTLPFPALMQEYEDTHDRKALIRSVRQRLDYVERWPSLLNEATSFHREVSVTPCLQTVITTNWDDYFERYARMTPFVYDSDMAFWDEVPRKVLKIHGTASNLGTLVLTSKDYAKRGEELAHGVIGAQLRLLLAQSVVVFAGYSLRDPDLLQIWDDVCRGIAPFSQPAYVVIPDVADDHRWQQLGLTPIHTGGAHFIQLLRRAVVAKGCMFSESHFAHFLVWGESVRKKHLLTADRFPMDKNPLVVYCLSYQDGLLDAVDYLGRQVTVGYSLCRQNVLRAAQKYEELADRMRSHGNYFDSAYVRGYLNGLIACLLEPQQRRLVPCYYDGVQRAEISTVRELAVALHVNYSNGNRRAKAARLAVSHDMSVHGRGMVFQHTPSFSFPTEDNN